MISRNGIEPGGESGISAETGPMPVGSEEYLLRQIESAPAIACEPEAPRRDAHVIAPEDLAEQILVQIAVSGHCRIAEHKHHFLVREAFRAVVRQAIKLRMKDGLSYHARIIVVAGFVS